MPFWAADSKEQADKQMALFKQLFADPDLNVRQQAAELLANELPQPIRDRFLRGVEQMGVLAGKEHPEIQEKVVKGLAELSAVMSDHFKQRTPD